MISVLFSQYHNFFLSIINNNFFRLNYQIYILIITIFILFIILRYKCIDYLKINSFFVFLIFFIILETISYLQKDIDLNFFLGIFLIFILLLNKEFYFDKIQFFLIMNLCIVFFITIIEILYSETYYFFVNIDNYLANTRNWYESTNVLSYFGSYRIDGNIILGFLDSRFSSIFLEPLNLAYFGYLNFLFFNYLRLINNSNLNIKYILIFFMCIFLIIVSDTRSVLILLILSLIIPKKIFYLHNFIFLFIAIFLIMIFLFFEFFPENLQLRLSYNAISSDNSLLNYLNLKPSIQKDNDSAFIIIFNNLGIFGFGFILIFIVKFIYYAKNQLDKLSIKKYFYHNIFLYLFIISLFGGAIFSIKNLLLLIFMINHVFFTNEKLSINK